MYERELISEEIELGQLSFIQVDRDLRGLNLQRNTEEGFFIDDLINKRRILITLLSSGGPVAKITSIVEIDSREFDAQLHDLKIDEAYNIKGTDIFISVFINKFEGGLSNLAFKIDAPRDFPVVRTELLDKQV